MKVTFIRHTTLQIAQGICYGQSDIDVSENFAQECQVLQHKLNPYQFDAVYTSPLQRCVKLAFALNLGQAIEDHRLKELNFGDWEMLKWDDIPRQAFDDWADDYANIAPPNGETFSALQMRGLAFLATIKATQKSHIAVISHAGIIRAMLAHALNIPLKSLFRFSIDHASITTLDFSHDIPKIRYVNR